MCCSNTPYLRVLKLLFNTVVAVYLKRIELFSSIAKKTLFFRYFNSLTFLLFQLHCFSQVNLADRPVPILEWEKPLCSFRNLFHMCIFWLFFAALYHNLKREKSMRSKGMLGVLHQ